MGAWIISAIVIGFAAVAFFVSYCAKTASYIREEGRLEAELKALMPELADARTVLRERDELARAAGEILGWENSRLMLGEKLQKAWRARPNSMQWSRVVVQSQFSEGERQDGFVYRPRVRTCRLILGGRVQGNLADPLVRSYVETLSEPAYFGSVFGAIKFPGLERKLTEPGAPALFTFALEGNTPVRPLDQLLP